jgi:hypothetical protein
VKVVESFEDDPDTYEEALQKTLARLVERSQPFAQQLQTLARQVNIQTGGVQGSVNVTGQGKIIGPSAAVNTGTMGGTFNVGGDDNVRHGADVFGMEVKVWRDRRPDPITDGLPQLEGYLARLDLTTGWLIIFDQRRGQPPIAERTRTEGAVTASGRIITVIRA